jgi:hypothetical protein
MIAITRIFIILLTIIAGIAAGALFYFKIFQPQVLEKMCLVNGTSCAYMSYWNYQNSVLIHMEPEGYWLWWDGNFAYVWDTAATIECPSEGDLYFQPAYRVPPYKQPTSSELKKVCISTIEDMIYMYENEFNVKQKFIVQYIKPTNYTGVWPLQGNLSLTPGSVVDPISITTQPQLSGADQLTIYDVLSIFNKRNIISI